MTIYSGKLKSHLLARLCILFASAILFATAILLAFPAQSRGDDPERSHDGGTERGYLGAAEPVTVSKEYGRGVRESDWRSPEEEQAGFHLPPGFKVNLFASEPQINKPLNMAWDHRGRLWITNTLEYPYPAKDDESARDSIKILEDTTGDGRADKTTTFADHLNIPMGLIPVDDGVICFSIPFIWHLKDVDGDDRVDERIKLLGPFDTTRDTHGMINALRRGTDGWIYACHGFNNQSEVSAADGSKVRLISGNTFRFKPDGSRIEQFTKGQVNPFGMTRDEFGNWYTADCHSKPITALLPGGCYSSFGRPHDGLGFAPEMMSHLHGSTAICGLHYYSDNRFPAGYRGLFYSGNVMTSRINCNRLLWEGATAKASELPDFMSSDDSWFRPVDIQLGPDGALYVADFYNRIIGHYEVDLEHPGRDRESGRIWRIDYQPENLAESQGNDDAGETSKSGGTKKASSLPAGAWLAGLKAACSQGNSASRRAAIDRAVSDASAGIGALKQLAAQDGSPALQLASLEILTRRNAIDGDVVEALSRHLAVIATSSPAQPSEGELLFAIQAVRMSKAWGKDVRGKLLDAIRELRDSEPHPQLLLASIEWLGVAGDGDDVAGLLHLGVKFDGKDAALTHSCKIAARNLLQNDSYLEAFVGADFDMSTLDGPMRKTFASVASGVNTQALTNYVVRHAPAQKWAVQLAVELALQHPPVAATNLCSLIDGAVSEGVIDQVEVAGFVGSLARAYRSTGQDVPQEWVALGDRCFGQVADQLRASGFETAEAWCDEQGNDWPLQERNLRHGESMKFRSSHAIRETYMATLASPRFVCPSELRFWLCGHNDEPSSVDARKNYVRLIASGSEAIICTAFPPRSDVGTEVVWDLSGWQGKSVRIEVVDGHGAGAYAWIAVGGFSLPELNTLADDSIFAALLSLVRSNSIGDQHEELKELLEAMPIDSRRRVNLVETIAASHGSSLVPAFVTTAVRMNRPALISNQLAYADSAASDVFDKLAQELAVSLDASGQVEYAKALLQSAEGTSTLASLIQGGKMQPSVMRGQTLPDRLAAPNAVDYLTDIKATSENDDAAKVRSASAILASLDWNSADAQVGKELFTKNCANCHQFLGQGTLVGPQLDGAVKRGMTRLIEDITQPNLNVDLAFRQSTLLLESDRIVTGLVRENENGDLVVISQDGKQAEYRAAEVVSRKDSMRSLMPDNFAELLSKEQLAHLLAFLTSSTNK